MRTNPDLFAEEKDQIVVLHAQHLSTKNIAIVINRNRITVMSYLRKSKLGNVKKLGRLSKLSPRATNGRSIVQEVTVKQPRTFQNRPGPNFYFVLISV